MGARELLEWQNLIFVLPFIAGLLYLGLLASGAVSAGHEMEVDADADMDHDFDHGVEHSLGHDGHDADHGVHHESMAMKAMSFLGFGKVPLSLIFLSSCFIWGFTGWASNMFFGGILRFPAVYIWPSLVVAAFSSMIFTRYLGVGLAKVMPTTETYGVRQVEFVGKVAEVRYTLTTVSGTATFYDRERNFQEVQCRVEPGQETIPSGERVVLMRYDEVAKAFVVQREPQGLRSVS
jgi:hypothetical protein